MAQTTSQNSSYRKEFKRFVVKLSRSLNSKECEELFYTYKEDARLSETLRPSSSSSEACQLNLLESLEKAREFSYDEPYKLKDLFKTVDRVDLIEEVDNFLERNEEEIAKLSQHQYAQLSSIYTLKGNHYGQATERVESPIDRDGLVKGKSSDQKLTSIEVSNGDYVQLHLPPLKDSVLGDTRQRSGSLDSMTQRQLPPPPEHKPRVQLKRRPGFRRQKRKGDYVPDSNGRYSYIDTRPRFLQVKTPPRPLSAISSSSTQSSCSTSYPLSLSELCEERLGTFTSSDDRSVSSTSPDINEFSESDSCDEHIYEYLPDSYDCALQLVTSEPRPLVEEEIKLMVGPIRKMIENSEQESVSTGKFAVSHHSVCNAFFQLKISTRFSTQSLMTTSESKKLDKSRNNSISADLFLVSDTAFPDSLLLKAHIQVLDFKQSPLCKQRNEFNSESIDTCICEQTVPLDLPTSCNHKGSASQIDSDQEFVPFCVASFPNLMSHTNFMNNKLISTPCLRIKLCVREYVY